MRSDTVIPYSFFDKKIAEVFGDVHSSLYLCIRKQGEVLEWLKRQAWKACNRQNRFAGSNPVLSAKLRIGFKALRRNPVLRRIQSPENYLGALLLDSHHIFHQQHGNRYRHYQDSHHVNDKTRFHHLRNRDIT